jgi:hypothetical protein
VLGCSECVTTGVWVGLGSVAAAALHSVRRGVELCVIGRCADSRVMCRVGHGGTRDMIGLGLFFVLNLVFVLRPRVCRSVAWPCVPARRRAARELRGHSEYG